MEKLLLFFNNGKENIYLEYLNPTWKCSSLSFTCTLELSKHSCLFFFFPFLYSKISRSGFYRIVPFNEGLEKLIFPSVAPLIAIHLIKLHGIFNLASWASILT